VHSRRAVLELPHITIGETMKSLELCCFCGKSDREARIIPWFVQTERLSMHMDCYLSAYGADVDADSLPKAA
jgi:hypothetical protein